ncbi:glycosyltransferase family 2 protein [Peribacillus simplex]|uniref:N-acetylgalactosaminyl-diphosphoundecaprenol glucuronosyltransferase n=1 Tax=Peribacillus simplex TaxID=1478 RepID=A0AAN2PJL2_9BACI|nr:glycosyltransferase family 2 protein [Peribacillus simplex]CEG33840.1 N-acetylgalactosaminyl-diphosphoundecaprenol glucuronosyltransferase [Peribacillus simplex]
MKNLSEFLLTVVIPNYNNAKYIKECIYSIFEQSYSGIAQVIIVDDCSTDNSIQVIEELMKEYPTIRLVALSENAGVSNARNMGLNCVQTKYVTFIDADDFYFNKDKLKNEMELIVKYKKQFGKDVLSYSSVVTAQNDLSQFFYPPLNKRAYLQGNVRINLLKGRNFKTIMRDYCISTQVLRNVGGYNFERNLYEDWELLLKLSRQVNFYCTFEYGTAYRSSINGLSKRPIYLLKEKKNEIFYDQIQDISNWVKYEIYTVKIVIDTKASFKRKYYQMRRKTKSILIMFGIYDSIQKKRKT